MASYPDQAQQLRKLVEETHAPGDLVLPPIIVVCGGRPGVGATTIACELARTFAGQGNRVALIHADLKSLHGSRRPDREKYSLGAFCSSRLTAAEALRSSEHGYLEFIADQEGDLQHDHGGDACRSLHRYLCALHGQLDHLLVDAGAGLSPWSGWWWSHARIVLAVTTPADVAVMDTYAMLKWASQGADLTHVRIAVNQSQNEREAGEVHRRISEACFRFLGELVPAEQSVPYDPIASDCVEHSDIGSGNFNAAIASMAGSLSGDLSLPQQGLANAA